MKLLSKGTDYAVRALAALAREPERNFSVRELSEAERIPYQFMRKILLRLHQASYVESQEGPRGGFRLRRQASRIKIAELIVLFQGRIQLSECMFRKKVCHNRARCVLRKNIMRIENMLVEEFGKITVETILKG